MSNQCQNFECTIPLRVIMIIKAVFVVIVTAIIHVRSDLGDVFRCLSQNLKEVDLCGQVAGPEVMERLRISTDELLLRDFSHQLHLKLSVYRPGLDHRHADRHTEMRKYLRLRDISTDLVCLILNHFR